MIAPDGSAAICARIEEGSVKVCGEAGWLHRFSEKMNWINRPASDGFAAAKTNNSEKNIDLEQYVSQCQQRLTSEILAELCKTLGVSAQSLKRLRIGWDGTAFTFPMFDFGNVIGVRRRFTNGSKGTLKGSQTGLFIPADLSNDGPLLICEGPTDKAITLAI